jgi:N-acetylmuramoyl-L-alanine amidase
MRVLSYLAALLISTSALACQHPAEFVLAIDVGHSPKRVGATSARGRGEYYFNQDLAQRLKQNLDAQQRRAFIITHANPEMELAARAALARARNAHLLLSLHHDSAQEHYLDTWIHQGQRQRYSDRFKGYSLFISADNKAFEGSEMFARYLGQALRDGGFAPTLHHAEAIPGENRLLLDEYLGIYRYDELQLLRSAKIPALLMEAGVIINRDEEVLLRDPAYQNALVKAIMQAVDTYAQQRCRR